MPRLQINKMTGTHKKCIKMGGRDRKKERKKNAPVSEVCVKKNKKFILTPK
jgi:hypothetical protein